MKRGAIAAATVFFILFTASVTAATKVGRVARIQGEGQAVTEGVTRPLGVDTAIFQDDSVRTGVGARLEIRFDDDTRLTLGANAEVTVDEFIYAVPNTTNRLRIGIKGAFRFISGKIARNATSQVQVRTPAAILGIRGTDLWGGRVDGAYGVLLREGVVEVTTPAGTAVLDSPGLGTTIARPGARPQPPSAWAAGKVERALAQVRFGDTPKKKTEDWRNLFLAANPVFDVRYRFETVDDGARPRNARAHTVRTRAGFETGRFHGLGFGADVEWIEALGTKSYNDTVSGRPRFPVVLDPEDVELNQFYLVADGTIPGTRFKFGRQRIQWDDQRFIGNSGFRQNEQTFDALRAAYTAISDLELEYVYFDEARGVSGGNSPVGRLGLVGHGLRGHYGGLEGVTLSPFALLLDYDRGAVAGLSSATFGLSMTGLHPIDRDWSFFYTASLAHQVDRGANPGDFGLWYYRLEPGIAYRAIRAKLGLEALGGDGANAFQTPLATLHAFNGVTDQFVTTPPGGLLDLYLDVEAPLPGRRWLSGLGVKAGYHQFWAEEGGAHYGSEWNIGLAKATPLKYGTLFLGFQYGAYEADRFSTDTDKFWLTVRFKLAGEKITRFPTFR